MAVARDGRDHRVKGIGGGTAVRRRICQRFDELELLNNVAGPAVRDADGQCIR